MKYISIPKIIFYWSLIIFSVNIQAQVNLNQGLAAYWNFNGNANDVSGNNNNGTVNGATLTTDKWGNSNGAYYFNGINNWIQVPNSPSLNFNSNSFTVYALLKVFGYYQGTCHGNSIIDRGAADNNPGAFNVRYVDGYYTNGANCSNLLPDTLHENFIGGCSNVFTPSVIPPQYIQNNTWYCVIAVNDGSHLKVYVNGVLDYDATLNGVFSTSVESIFVGRHNSVAYPYWMKGILDELRIYNRALNLQEVDSLCNYNPNGPLPATINNFTGIKLELSDKLSWTTSSEQNNALFNLQHSTDGKNFSTIAKINSNAPNGNSASTLYYNYLNTNPVLGHNYYKLQQFDLDNNVSEHTQIVDLIRGANTSTVRIYPNPARDFLNIDLYVTKSQNTIIKLLDMSGRVIKHMQIKSAIGINNIKLNLGEIVQGVYTIQIYENDILIHKTKVRTLQ